LYKSVLPSALIHTERELSSKKKWDILRLLGPHFWRPLFSPERCTKTKISFLFLVKTGWTGGQNLSLIQTSDWSSVLDLLELLTVSTHRLISNGNPIVVIACYVNYFLRWSMSICVKSCLINICWRSWEMPSFRLILLKMPNHSLIVKWISTASHFLIVYSWCGSLM
jgi:hypothetical protein